MKMKHIFLPAMAVFALSAGSGVVAMAQASDLSLLETLDRGLWELRSVGGGGGSGASVAKMCLGDPSRLTQIQHNDFPCSRYVVRSTPTSVTVSYSCRGQGQGLTTIRKESGKLIHIQSQGIRNNSPFSFSVEARRIGTC